MYGELNGYPALDFFGNVHPSIITFDVVINETNRNYQNEINNTLTVNKVYDLTN